MSTHQNTDSASLKYDNSLPESLDYLFFRKEGIRYTQEMSGNIWTDYNEHDPGVTILEQCCFALTDIAYRTNIDIEKILFSGTPEIKDDAKNREKKLLSNCIYQPEDVLLSSNVTLNDFKMLFIDSISLINNIWFNKVDKSNINGLYDVYVRPNLSYEAEFYSSKDVNIDFVSTIYRSVGDDTLQLNNVIEKDILIEKQIRSLFNANRNISEDINNVVVLRPDDIEMAFEIDLFEDSRVEEVLADIYTQLDDYFNCKIEYDSIDSLIGNGLGFDEIFDRPSFDNSKGFINKKSIEEYQTIFSISKIQAKISDVTGVRFARNLVVRQNEIKITGDQIVIPHGYYASIGSIIRKSVIRVLKKGNVIVCDLDKVKILCIQKDSERKKNTFFNRSIHKRSTETHDPNALINYSSIQNFFPATYGIGQYGLSDFDGIARKEYVKQLQSYILFFDQILLNHLTQLKNSSILFSIEPNQENEQKTYFENYNNRIPNIDDLVKPELAKDMYGLIGDDYAVRKNGFLDHLLARFSERFVDESHRNLKNIYGVFSDEELQFTLMNLKCSFLKQYRNISQNRNKSFNYEIYTVGEINDATIIPIKKKLFLLLNLPPENEGCVSLLSDYTSISSKDVSEKERGEMKEFGKSIVPDNKSCYKTFNQVNAKKATFIIPEGLESLSDLIYYGSKQDNYSILKSENSDSEYTVFFIGGYDIPIAIYSAQTYNDAQKAIQILMKKFFELNKKSEGFHVVEHILLRPVLEEPFYLKIFLNKDECTDTDDHFVAIKNASYDQQKELLFELIVLGLHASNFKIVESFDDSSIHEKIFTIELQSPTNVSLLRLNKKISSLEDANDCINNKLVGFFNDLSEVLSNIPQEVVIKEVGEEKFKEDLELNNFYNNTVSLIFPNWLPRFNEPDFRAMLQSCVAACLPAHIFVDIKWFDRTEMGTFESVYFDWLKLKSEDATNGFNLNSFADSVHNLPQQDGNDLYVLRTTLDTVSKEIIKIFLKSKSN